jgi:hypothetical protein
MLSATGPRPTCGPILWRKSRSRPQRPRQGLARYRFALVNMETSPANPWLGMCACGHSQRIRRWTLPACTRDVAHARDIHPLMLSRWRKRRAERRLGGKHHKIVVHRQLAGKLRELCALKQRYALLKGERELSKNDVRFCSQTKSNSSRSSKPGDRELGERAVCLLRPERTCCSPVPSQSWDPCLLHRLSQSHPKSRDQRRR